MSRPDHDARRSGTTARDGDSHAPHDAKHVGRTPLEQELERRIAILDGTGGEQADDRDLPHTDRLVLAVLTIGSVLAVWIAQAV